MGEINWTQLGALTGIMVAVFGFFVRYVLIPTIDARFKESMREVKVTLDEQMDRLEAGMDKLDARYHELEMLLMKYWVRGQSGYGSGSKEG